MMQQVAASKTDLAALGVGKSVDDYQAEAGLSEQFRQTLKSQESATKRQEKGYAEPVEPAPAPDARRKSEAPERNDTKPTSAQQNDKPNDPHSAESADESDATIKEDAEQPLAEANAKEAKTGGNTTQDENTRPGDQQETAEAEEESSEADIELADTVVDIDWLALLESSRHQLQQDGNPLPAEAQVQDNAIPSADASDEGEQQQLLSEQSKAVEVQTDDNDVVDTLPFADLMTMLREALGQGESSAQQTDTENPSFLDSLSEDQQEALDQLLSQLQAMLSADAESSTDAEQAQLSPAVLAALLNQSATGDASNGVLKDFDLAALDALPETSQQQVLEQLARDIARAVTEQAAAQTTDQAIHIDVAQAQVATLQASSVMSDNLSRDVQKDALAKLTAGLQEFSEQLKQGHTPGMDLKQFIAQVVEQVSEQQQVPVNAADIAADIVRLTQHSAELAQQLSAQLSQGQQLALADRLVQRDSVQQVAAEMQRQGQTAAQHERAINIAQPEGHNQLAERVRYLVNQNTMQADIRLDPPDLGSMKVRINMSGETASVSFVVQSPQARDMLDQAVPRLRELLEENGIELGQSSVEQEQGEKGDGETDGKGSGQMAGEHHEDDVVPETGQHQRIVNGALGGIDYFV